MKRKFEKSAISVLLAVILLSGAIWQSAMVQTERKSYPAIGKFADLQTYQAHYYTKGNGDVAFVFIAGSGTPCAFTDFYALQNKLSAIGQTITFDHAGSGWSTDTEAARTIDNLVKELSALIDTVAPNKPVILLCHSLGSLETIGYAQAHPERVAGIVFFDSGSPEFYRTDSEFLAKAVNRASALLKTVGVTRLFGQLGLLLPLYGENTRNPRLPDNLKSLDKAMYYRLTGNPASLNTIKLINENAANVLAGPSLGQTPILVLSADNGSEWNDVQIQLASWSENSKQITIQNSDHYLYWSNFDEAETYIDVFLKDNLE